MRCILFNSFICYSITLTNLAWALWKRSYSGTIIYKTIPLTLIFLSVPQEARRRISPLSSWKSMLYTGSRPCHEISGVVTFMLITSLWKQVTVLHCLFMNFYTQKAAYSKKKQQRRLHCHLAFNVSYLLFYVLHGIYFNVIDGKRPGCEISTGPRTHASGILVGPVENLV